MFEVRNVFVMFESGETFSPQLPLLGEEESFTGRSV